MLKYIRAIVFAGSLVCVANNIFAQEIKMLTLDEAIAMGLNNSKLLSTDDAKKMVVKAKYDQLRFSNIPSLVLSSSYLYNSPNVDEAKFVTAPSAPTQLVSMTLHNQNQNKLSLSQAIFSGLRLYNNTAANKKLMAAANFDYEKDKADIKNNIATAYFNQIKLKESKKIVEENIKILQARKKDISNIESVGMALKNDVIKVDMALLNLQQTNNEVLSAIDISNFNLCVLLGLPETTQIEGITTELTKENAATTKAEWLEKSVNTRNDLKAAGYRVDAYKSFLKASKANYYPTLSAGANLYVSNPNSRIFLIPESNKRKYYYSWDIGLALNWNLTNLFTTTFQTREAKANLKQSELMQQQLVDASKMEVSNAFSNYKLALDKIEIAKQLLEKAKEDQRITKNQYENGVKKITDMLDADNAVTTNALNLTTLKIDAEIAYSKLLKAVGTY